MRPDTVWLITLVVVATWYLSSQAGRLDRLHHRIEVSQASLDGHLTRRAGIAVEIVALNFLDPASEAYLVQSAHDVLAGADLPDPQRLLDESELTEALADAFEDDEIVLEFRSVPAVDQLLNELLTVSNRVVFAKRFHAEAVQDCLAIRGQLFVRLFRLMGFAKQPANLDFDDRLPPALIP
jgi:hypothetical protein